MWFSSFMRSPKQSGLGQRRRIPASPRQRSTFRPRLEALEDRMMPSTYYAATAADLIADINAANNTGGTNTIVLTAPTTSPYVSSSVNYNPNGADVLPVIKNDLTIVTSNGTTNPGYGDTISQSVGGRLFDVASGASLTLENLTLQGGGAGNGSAPDGGAIYNLGTLVLNDVLVAHNNANGYPGQAAAGGGIWSNGSLTVENACAFEGNSAQGWYAYGNAYGGAIYIAGGTANISGSSLWGNSAQGGGSGFFVGPNGSGYGGAIYVAGGTVTLNADTISSNIAEGPSLSYYGYGYGGGLYVAAGSVTLTNDSIQGNHAGGYPAPEAIGWSGGGASFGPGYGGGIFIASGAKVYLDPFTVANTINNSINNPATHGESDIDGTYHKI